MDAVKQVLDEDQQIQFEKKTANELKRGYASFHHPLMMHGSCANYSVRSRRAVVINAMGHNTLGNTAGYNRLDALSGFPDMPQDKLLNSRFFPMLLDNEDPAMKALVDNIPTIKPRTD